LIQAHVIHRLQQNCTLAEGIMAHGHVVFGVVLGLLMAKRGMAVLDDISLMQFNARGKAKPRYSSPASSDVLTQQRRTNSSAAYGTFISDELADYIKFKNAFVGFDKYDKSVDSHLKSIHADMDFVADRVGKHVNDVKDGKYPELFAIMEKTKDVDFTDATGHPVDHRIDMDQDGHVNEIDGDIDGDHIINEEDAFPDNIFESKDFDNDGIGNNEEGGAYGDLDADGMVNVYDIDIDGDGVTNMDDDLPHDPAESVDADKDNIGDTMDAFPDDANYHKDDDGNGVPDYEELDPDGDGAVRNLELQSGNGFQHDESNW